MPKARPRAIRKYSDEFKLTAVRLSQQVGVQVKTVATALEIHPFMLSKWRRDFRDVSRPYRNEGSGGNIRIHPD